MNRFDQAEENICELKQFIWNYTVRGEKRMKRNEESLRDLRDTIKRANILIMRVPEEEERKLGRKLIERNNSWKLPNLGRDMDIQNIYVLEAQSPQFQVKEDLS